MSRDDVLKHWVSLIKGLLPKGAKVTHGMPDHAVASIVIKWKPFSDPLFRGRYGKIMVLHTEAHVIIGEDRRELSMGEGEVI